MKKAILLLSALMLLMTNACTDSDVVAVNKTEPKHEVPDDEDENDENDKKDDNDKKNCEDECEKSECIGLNQIKDCKIDKKSGCKKWSEPQNCPEDEECQDGKCSPLVPPCSDTCDKAAECVGDNAYRTCADTNDDGCKEWSEAISCAQNEKCQDGVCAVPPPTCTNACNNKGDLQCSGNNLQTCDDYNEDGCLEWGKDTACEYGCADSACKDWVPECTTDPCPKPITQNPQTVPGNTADGKPNISSYPSCTDFNKTDVANEGGPENYYVINITEPGYLAVGVSSKSKVDVDVHILSSLDGDHCLARGDKAAGHYLDPGIYYISVDTFESMSKAGEYSLQVTFIPDSGKCGMKRSTMKRRKTCGEVQMPATGPVATEAHLVTDYDRSLYDKDGKLWWPANQEEHIDTHKAHTDELFGTGTSSGAKWCPAEGGNIGSGSSGKFVPADAEAWYINMNWDSSTKPAKGTRYLVIDPVSGKTVVAAAGYETGPGSCDRMGGAVYEIRKYTSTDHGDTMTFGELSKQDFPFGPINCFEE